MINIIIQYHYKPGSGYFSAAFLLAGFPADLIQIGIYAD